MEKNIKINKIIYLLIFILFSSSLLIYSYDEILLYRFYNTDIKSNIEFYEDFKDYLSGDRRLNSYLEINYSFENYSQEIESSDSYTNISWRAGRNLPEKINFIFGNKKIGLNLTLGSFSPVYNRELSYSDSNSKYEISGTVGEGIRYYRLFIYYSFGKFLTAGVCYGRVFGENKFSETTETITGDSSETVFSYTNEHISGVYKYLYIEVIPAKFLKISGFFPKNITGSYVKNYYYKDNNVITTDYSLYYAIPIMFGVKLDFKKFVLFGNYRFTEKNIYSFDENSNYEFKGINNSKWNMYEIGGKVLLNNPFVRVIKVSYEKGKYFILDKDSEAPKIYSLNGSALITYRNIVLKLRYEYLFSKTYLGFLSENPLTKIKGSKFEISIGFSL
jgi:hypothetical protein